MPGTVQSTGDIAVNRQSFCPLMGVHPGGSRQTKTNKYIIDEMVVKCHGEKHLVRKAIQSNTTVCSVHLRHPHVFKSTIILLYPLI